MQKRNYGLFTAITMIMGIVIGSGIFFKADDILTYAGGNVMLGIIIFCVAAIAIVFGSLSISQLATRTDKPGGLVSYAESFVGMGTATVFGWFETFLYLPTLCAVVSWASGIYISQLMGYEDFSVGRNTIIAAVVITVFYLFNTLSAKLGGLFQNAAMIIKLIPLIAIAVLGLVFGQPAETVSESYKTFSGSVSNLGWLAAFGPVAFSFDGWIVSTSICHEIKDSKKNLPIALSIAPIAVLAVYLAYFIGIASYVGPEAILEHGDSAVYIAAERLFGSWGAKVTLVAVVISILGTVNGVVLGLIRLPYSLALRNMMPCSDTFKKENKKLGGMPVNSSILIYCLSMFYLLIHHLLTSSGVFGNHDISEISICMLYMLYIILYVAVIRLCKKGEIKNKFFGYVVPALAIVGSLIIFSGAVTSMIFLLYAAICAVFIIGSFVYYKTHKNAIK